MAANLRRRPQRSASPAPLRSEKFRLQPPLATSSARKSGISTEQMLACAWAALLLRGPTVGGDTPGDSGFAPWSYNALYDQPGGLGSLDLALLCNQGFIYYLIGALMAMLVRLDCFDTSGTSTPGDRDTAIISVMRVTSRCVVSTTMYLAPPAIIFSTAWQGVWNPWTGGQWCTPLGNLESWLLHMQLMYYVSDMPLTIFVGDVEQIIHHSIGVFLVLPTLLSGSCGTPTVAGLWCLQGSTIFTRYVKILRLFPLPKYGPVEKALVRLNYLQCFIFFLPCVATPLLLNVAWQCFTTKPFAYIILGVLCGTACIAQLAYEWYWNLRMRRAWISYQKKVEAAGTGVSDAPVFTLLACTALGCVIVAAHIGQSLPYQPKDGSSAKDELIYDTGVWSLTYVLWVTGCRIAAPLLGLTHTAEDNFPAWTFPAVILHQGVVLPVAIAPALTFFAMQHLSGTVTDVSLNNTPVNVNTSMLEDPYFFGTGDVKALGWAANHVVVPAGIAHFVADHLTLDGFLGAKTLGIAGMAHHMGASVALFLAMTNDMRGKGVIMVVLVVMEIGSLFRNFWAVAPTPLTVHLRVLAMDISNLVTAVLGVLFIAAAWTAYQSGELSQQDVVLLVVCNTILWTLIAARTIDAHVGVILGKKENHQE